ncbi:MAG TPA: hypothetical protein VK081_09795, partial [Planctomycetota bacterium]|nr:hypothetical protein [Planctomycetota bacterium]
NFGSPAVQVDNSRVLLTRCLLGVTSLGIGGGQCIGGQNATIDVVEPRFDAAYAGIPAIALNQCTLRLAGSSNSYVQGGAPFGGPASPAVQANGGTVRIDPAVALNPFVAGTPVGGSAAVTFASTPGSFVVGNNPNGVLTITYTAAPGASLYGLLGVPAAPLPTPFGDALLDPNLFVVVTATTVGGSGRHDVALPIPGGIPPGAAFATQGVVVQGGPPQLGIGCQFVVH